MKNGEPSPADDILTTAMAVRTADSIDQHLGNVQHITRMALDDSTNAVQTMRDEVIDSLRETNEMNAKLIEQLSELLTFFKQWVPTTPIVNVPHTNVTLNQQPVEVNVPKAALSFNPTVNVPEVQVRIDRPPMDLPKTATVKHSDGSQSFINFGK